MTVDEAIDIAWSIDKLAGEPRPNAEEALAIIEEQLRNCGCNWITGQAARDALTPITTKEIEQ